MGGLNSALDRFLVLHTHGLHSVFWLARAGRFVAHGGWVWVLAALAAITVYGVVRRRMRR